MEAASPTNPLPAQPRSFVDICDLCSLQLCQYSECIDVYAILCAASQILSGVHSDKSNTAPVKHLKLLRGGDDGRDAAVLEKAPWSQVQSLETTQASLYIVQDGLLKARALLNLDIDLLFPEPFAELVPFGAACMAGLRKLVLRRCYSDILDGLSEALTSGMLPSLRELELLGSPKSEIPHATSLAHYASRPNQQLNLSCAGSLALAIAESRSIEAIVVDRVSAFCAPTGIEHLAVIASRPHLRCLHLVNSVSLGHVALISILASLVSTSPRLESLSLAPAMLCTAAFDEAARLGTAIARVLLSLENLRDLRLTWCGIGDDGAAMIIDGIVHSSCSMRASLIRAIDLSQNCIAEAATDLVRILCHAPRLEALVLEGSGVEEAQLKQVFESARQMHTMVRAHGLDQFGHAGDRQSRVHEADASLGGLSRD